jgi:hypothetical protein
LPARSWPRVVGLSCLHAVPPTGDLHPICNAPMMGAHQRVQVTARKLAEPDPRRSDVRNRHDDRA